MVHTAHDFLKLNPVKAHTLVEALCKSKVPRVPAKTQGEYRYGYKLCRSACKNVIIFTGTHRFLDSDLPALLQIMATPGGLAGTGPATTGLHESTITRIT